VLGRSPSHRKALLRNLASALFLTERDLDPELDENIPKVKGRIVTTLHKAKEVRPLVEKCITIARHALVHEREAQQYETHAEHGTEAWRQWRNGDEWQKWSNAMAPAVTARRRVLQLIGDKEAVRVLFDDIASRYEDRDGGYTRILRLAQPRLGDGGTQAILELVGTHERVREVSEKPAFGATDEDAPPADETDASAQDESAGADETAPEAQDAGEAASEDKE
jgi:large subunit ribosomal protein L17